MSLEKFNRDGQCFGPVLIRCNHVGDTVRQQMDDKAEQAESCSDCDRRARAAPGEER